MATNRWERLLGELGQLERYELTLLSHALTMELELRERPAVRPEIREAQAYVQARLGEPLTVHAVSAYVGLSPHYFGRLFREASGESFTDYVTRVRMDKARELLLHSSLKVYEIAQLVGVQNYRYFHSLFRRRHGKKPSEYRGGI